MNLLVEAIQNHISSSKIHKTRYSEWKEPVSWIVFEDGTKMSVQASTFAYCSPKSNQGPWTHVEVMTFGFVPKHWLPDEDGLAGYIPVELVAKEIEHHRNKCQLQS